MNFFQNAQCWPECVARNILDHLPLMDAVVYRRVCRQFDRLLLCRLQSLKLEELVLVRQFRDRRLGIFSQRNVDWRDWDYLDVVIRCVRQYGGHLIRLTLVLPVQAWPKKDLATDITLKQLLLCVVENCPNLVELLLQSDTIPENVKILFPADLLLKLPHLLVLGAELEWEDTGSNRDSIFTKILQMRELSSLNLENGFLLKRLFDSSEPIVSVREIRVESDFERFDLFPNLEGLNMTIYNTELLPTPYLLALFPRCLLNLDLTVRKQFTLDDCAALGTLTLLVRFTVDCYYDRGIHDVFPTFNFLRNYDKLEWICVKGCSEFTEVDFALIPIGAPLQHILLFRCHVECGNLYQIIMDRDYPVVTLQLYPFIFVDRGLDLLLNHLSNSLRTLSVAVRDNDFQDRFGSRNNHSIYFNDLRKLLQTDDRVIWNLTHLDFACDGHLGSVRVARKLIKRRKAAIFAGSRSITGGAKRLVGKLLGQQSRDEFGLNGDDGPVGNRKGEEYSGCSSMMQFYVPVSVFDELKHDGRLLMDARVLLKPLYKSTFDWHGLIFSRRF